MDELVFSTFEAARDEGGRWYVNQYIDRPSDVTRRETVFDDLPANKAHTIAKTLNGLVAKLQKLVKDNKQHVNF